MDREESRAVIKFLTLQGKSYTDVHRSMVEVYGDKAPSTSTCFRWNLEFRRGRESCKDDPHTGRPKSATDEETVAIVKKVLDEDRRQTIQKIADKVEISVGSTYTIIRFVLKMTRVAVRWVPRFLTDGQRQKRVDASEKNLRKYEEDKAAFITAITTQDESFLNWYEPESKQESSQWRTREEGPPLKFKKVASAGKVLGSIFWDREGVIKSDYIEQGNTVNGPLYAQEIRDLRNDIKEKRRGKLSTGVLYLHDNAPAHTSRTATAAIRQAGFQVLDHPPYSPDLAPSDFHLFPNLKKHLRGTRYESNQEVIQVVEDWFQRQSEDFWSEAFEKLIHRYERCIEVQGQYVEKQDNLCD